MTNLVNLRNVDDIERWLQHPDHVYIGRGTEWGNPFKVTDTNNREQAVHQYENYIKSEKKLSQRIGELKGKILGCWCSPLLCHGVILHQLAGNVPATAATMSKAHNTSVQSDGKPPLSPKPTITGKRTKLTTAQLQEKVESLELHIHQLMEDSSRKDDLLRRMECRITQLEANEIKNTSYLLIQKNVSTLLSNRISQLEQYTRRYSVIVSGIKRNPGENKETIREKIHDILQEAGSATTLNDVDKCHRNGPPHGEFQDVIVRFKSHEAKEAFYKQRKNIAGPDIKVKPSLSSYNYNLLKEAREEIKCFTTPALELDNPPEFVFANMHGDLQVKLSKKTRDGTMFYSFNSMQRLYEILEKYTDSYANSRSEQDIGYFDHPRAVFPRPKSIAENGGHEAAETFDASAAQVPVGEISG